MEVQKIAGYEQRMQEYRIDCRRFWLKEFPLFAAITAVGAFGSTYGLSRIGATSDPDWHLMALLIWAVSLVPLVIMMLPEKPHPNDVLWDQALRRAAGMDDSVEE